MHVEYMKPHRRAVDGRRTRVLRIDLGSALLLRALWCGLASTVVAAPACAGREGAGAESAATVAIAPSEAGAAPASEAWAVHGQGTGVVQWHPSFRAAYDGPNSLRSGHRNAETTDFTLYAGVRPWRGAELWINPEIDQGFGLDNTVGVAGFPSGEAYKVGAHHPYIRLPRAFVRQVFELAGEREDVAGAANQLAGARARDNVTVTVGKFSVVDVFDVNGYAHDPRADFLNWSIIDAGAFDYAADAWGYTFGAAAEWNQSDWTLRGGFFALSREPNGKMPDTTYRQNASIVEVERRYRAGDHPGKVRLLGFVNRGDMASYGDAVARARALGTTPDLAPVRRFASRAGAALGLEQELAADLGVFARVSLNDGRREAFEFTEINRSLSGGLSLHGSRWGRADDVAGAAVAVNGLAGPARDYFAAGGLGILIGDGRLNYASERVAELYYALRAARGVTLSLNYQYIVHPAYNADRGPVSIVGLRLHGEF